MAPEMVMEAPTGAAVVDRAVMTGGGIYTNPGSETVPPAVVTVTFPDDPVPTSAVMVVGETTVKYAAGVPPKLTAVAPVKFVPVRVMVVPEIADVGKKDVIVG